MAGALDFDAPPSPVAESGCGIAVKPEAPDEIVMAVRKLVTMSPEERNTMGQCGRKNDARLIARPDSYWLQP